MTSVDLSNWGADVPQFVRLLAAEVKMSDRSKAGQRIGMSRSAVSLILSNKYPSPSTRRVERRVMEVLGRIQCVALDEPLTVEQCQGFYQKQAPTHNPQAMQHWRACQHCPFNPNCGGNSHATVH